MLGSIMTFWLESDVVFRRRFVTVYGLLLAANVAAWAWAVVALRGNPVLLGTALLAYAFGLRHAVDADHIAAIDNATRKLMQARQRPVAVGLFFALGHSAVVLIMAVAVGYATAEASARFELLRTIGSIVGTCVSASFLFLLAAFNMIVLAALYRTFQRVRRGEAFSEGDFDILLNSRGLLSRLFRPLFGLVTKSWHLFPVGFLLGMGFDTATEVALFGISATQAAKGMPLSTLLVFPALFTAGMTLVDTTDGVLMLGAYGWAFLKPMRKLYYNLTITAVSVAVALLIGGVETLGLIGDSFKLEGRFWDGVGALNDNFGTLGYAVIALFALCWAASAALYRLKGYDAVEVRAAP